MKRQVGAVEGVDLVNPLIRQERLSSGGRWLPGLSVRWPDPVGFIAEEFWD